MIIEPSIGNFESDQFVVTVADGVDIAFCIMDESFVTVNEILVEARYAGSTLRCTNIIGAVNSFFQIESDDPSLYGQKISKDNLGLWRAVVNV